MIARKKVHAFVLALIFTILCTACNKETLAFYKHIENSNVNYGTNLEFYENRDVFATDSGESVSVSLKTFLAKYPETGNYRLSFNFELAGFEANRSIKVKKPKLLLKVNNATLTRCELYDSKKISKNFYEETTAFEHQFENVLNIKDQYLAAFFDLSGDPELIDITIEFTYDLMDAKTSIKDCKIVQSF